MKNSHLTRLLTLSFLLSMCSMAISQIPQQINYQCLLTDAAGTPLNGNFSVSFAIYDVPTGGSSLWGETHTVAVVDGLCTVLLGSSNPIPLVLFDIANRYLGIRVEADPELVPRQIFASVAYAFNAQNAITGGDDGDWNVSGNSMVSGVSGNVGIGIGSPAEKLDVNGTIRSLSGGFKFPDGSVQTTAATNSGDNDWIVSGNNMSAGVTGNVNRWASACSSRNRMSTGTWVKILATGMTVVLRWPPQLPVTG